MTYRIFGLLFIALLLGCDAEETPRTLFEEIPATQSGISFRNNLAETEAFNIIEYLYYFNGGGVGVGDFDKDGLPDVFLTGNEVADRLYRNLGDFKFEDITEAAGIQAETDQSWSTGVSIADVNGDGWLDIYVCRVDEYKGRQGRNELFINQGKTPLRFVESAADYGLAFSGFGQQAAFFDYDLDGDLDVYLLNHSVHSPDNYGDSRLREGRSERAGDRLLRNDNNQFVNVSKEAGILSSKIGYGLSIAVADLNDDRYPDIYVTNDFAEQDYLYLNQGDGTFKERIAALTSSTSQFSMGIDVADLNDDRLPDIFTLDMRPADETLYKSAVGPDPYNLYQHKINFGYHYQYPRNHLQLSSLMNDAQEPQYRENAEQSGVSSTDWSWSVLLEDFNLDGGTDAYITNGIWRRPNDLDYLRFTGAAATQRDASDLELAKQMPDGRAANEAFSDLRDYAKTERVAVQWGLDHVGCSNGAAIADFDGDGDPDLLVNNLNEPVSLYRNRTYEDSLSRGLKVQLIGNGANTQGMGAIVRVRTAREQSTPHKEMRSVRGWQSSSEAALYFGGLAEKEEVQVTVYWPSGAVSEVTTRNRILTVREGEHTVAAEPQEVYTPLATVRELPTGLNYRHQEDTYTDFDTEKLMPRKLSTEGPALLVADLTGDGLEDLLIGGAAGQGSGYFVATSDSTYSARALPDIPALEVVDIQAFDADGDQDLDLYLVHGGGLPGPLPNDLLLLSDGTGNFTPGPPLPVQDQGAFAVAFDYDEDGDLDIFRGSKSTVGAYGIAPKSYLLENQGGNRFVDVSEAVLPQQRIGLLSAAVWLSKERSLYVVGEWTNLHRLNFKDPTSVTTTMVGSSGWWFSLAAADVDGDGDTDLIGGNLGLNTPFTATADEPLRLYVKDFDQNGAPDPLLTYYRDGRERLFADKDALVGQMPGLRKRFPQYGAFAKADFSEVFHSEQLRGASRKEITQLASVWWERTADGQWKEHELPKPVQRFPIRAILEWQPGSIIVAGGAFEFSPAVGRLGGEAWRINFISGGVSNAYPLSVPVYQEVRSLQKLGLSNLILGVNNDSPLMILPGGGGK